MRLSWIIGSFNRPGRMRTCLASIVDQEPYGDWEAIVTDNSDNAECRAQIEELCKLDPRIRYEYTGERAFDSRIGIRSLYTANEIGVEMSCGEWLVFPNCDSYYAPWFAQRMLEKADSEKLEFVYCNFVHGRPDIMHYPFDAQPWGCAIDKTCFMLRREWFIPFPEQFTGNYGVADGVLVNALVAKGIRHGKLPQLLVVHN